MSESETEDITFGLSENVPENVPEQNEISEAKKNDKVLKHNEPFVKPRKKKVMTDEMKAQLARAREVALAKRREIGDAKRNKRI
jgi:hypothetical protein